MFWNKGSAQPLVVTCKYWVVPLTSTRVSGYTHIILFCEAIDIGTFPYKLTTVKTMLSDPSESEFMIP